MLHILCVSDSHKHFSAAVEEYSKRMPKLITITCLKPSRKDDPISAIKEETMRIGEKLIKLPKPYFLLEKDGYLYSSLEFAHRLETEERTGTLIIGGPYGVDVSYITSLSAQVLSRGKQTMPHGLALVVTLEQIRRAHCLSNGKTYHY